MDPREDIGEGCSMNGYSEEEWISIAYHEAGHAIAGMIASKNLLGDFRGTKQVMIGRLCELPSPHGNGRVALCIRQPNFRFRASTQRTQSIAVARQRCAGCMAECLQPGGSVR